MTQSAAWCQVSVTYLLSPVYAADIEEHKETETTPIPAVDISLTKSVVVHSSVPAIGLQPLPVTVEDVQGLVISAVSEPSQTSDQPLQAQGKFSIF